jgi:hypothetical protein
VFVVQKISQQKNMRRTGGKLHKGRMMSYGYFLNVHTLMIVVCGMVKEQEILNITHNGCKYK